MRTRILPRMLNDEVEEYLSRNDIIIVPVGTVEMHGGFPLDSETTISEAFALEMAEACDGLVLTGLPYFYAGATASGRGTVQVSVREGIDYLMAVANSLLRQGFKRQIYISFHGPAHMTCSPMVRDFFDETGVPILYMDLTMQMMKNARDIFTSMDSFHAITVGAYQKMNRLSDVPLTTEYAHNEPQSCAGFEDIFGLAYQSAAIGYYFGEKKDHNGCRNNTGTAKDQLDALRQMCKDAAAGSDSIAKSQCDGDDRDIAHRHRFFGNKLDSADHDG